MPSDCPAALPPADSASHLATPLFRGRTCHRQLPLANRSCSNLSSHNGRKGGRGSRVTGTEGASCPGCRPGSLREELPWAICSASGSLVLQRRNQVIFIKPREQNFLTFYLYRSDLKAASSPFFGKKNKTKLPPMKTNAFNKKPNWFRKKNLSGSTVCKEFSMDVIWGVLLKTPNIGMSSPRKLLGILTSRDYKFCLKLWFS